jgi:hypothetical protein
MKPSDQGPGESTESLPSNENSLSLLWSRIFFLFRFREAEAKRAKRGKTCMIKNIKTHFKDDEISKGCSFEEARGKC